MSNSPADDERLDTDSTDELPILLETAVLEPEERHVSLVVGDDATGEQTAHYPALAAHESANIDALKDDLEQRGAKIVALEQDISRLSGRWLDIERHLTAKDTLIDELKATLVSLRGVLDSRNAAEQRLSAEVADRDSQVARAVQPLEQLRQEATARDLEIARHKRERQTALDQLASAKDQLAAEAAASREPVDLQSLREEVATLASYIANRRTWWDEIEARVAAQTARIAELETEVAHRTERQQRADSLAEREGARAQALREQLVAQSRRTETLDAELDGLRTEPSPAQATVEAFQAQLADATAAVVQTQARLTEASQALAQLRAAHARRDEEHAAALAAAEERRAAELAAAEERRAVELAAAAESAAKAVATVTTAPPPRASFEVIAQLEGEVEQKRAELVAERATARELNQRLGAATADLESVRRQLVETRADLDQARADAARIERAVIDKDRALQARDERIATLESELDKKLGALQKLSAMDLSLQGLDSKMSERLRRTDTPVDQPNTPALVCLTSDVPRQYALNKKTMIIGRSSRCDIQLLTQFVSREHARVTLARGAVVIEDLGSTNGIFVNSVRVDRRELRHGDLVTVGETQFRFLESMAH